MYKSTYEPLNKVTLNKEALLHNIETIKSISNKTYYFPVLKSNAYGHGINELYPLIKELQFPIVCVDSLFEAFEIFKINPKQEILITGFVDYNNLSVKQLPFQYAVWDINQIIEISKRQKNAKFHLFVDTGMHREGIQLDKFQELCESIPNNLKDSIVGIMTHFASAEDFDSKQNAPQIENFKKAIEIAKKSGLKPKYIHSEASAATLRKLANITNSARFGLATYGISPIEENSFNLEPVLAFYSKIIQIKEIKKGDQIGYNGTFTADKNMKIAILPLGYNDGFDRRLSNKGFVQVLGKMCKIVGRISMNVSAIDITEVTDAELLTKVEIFSSKTSNANSIVNSAKTCSTITYDLLVHINPTIRREII